LALVLGTWNQRFMLTQELVAGFEVFMAVKMEETKFSETLVSYRNIKPRQSPENLDLSRVSLFAVCCRQCCKMVHVSDKMAEGISLNSCSQNRTRA
jgi:hypothetical protein